MWFTLVMFVMVVTQCSGLYERCSDLMGCRCLPRMKSVVCVDKATDYFPSPYGYWGYRITNLYLAGNKIRDIPKETVDLWRALKYLDIQRNPLSSISCDVLKNLEIKNITVLHDCKFISEDQEPSVGLVTSTDVQGRGDKSDIDDQDHGEDREYSVGPVMSTDGQGYGDKSDIDDQGHDGDAQGHGGDRSGVQGHGDKSTMWRGIVTPTSSGHVYM